MSPRRPDGTTNAVVGASAEPLTTRPVRELAHAVPLARRLELSYSPAIDTLRTFAMAAVVIYHASFLQVIRGAGFAVSMFFTLSGFLMTSILAREFESDGTVKVRSFWVKRIKRLLPATIAALWVVIAYGATVASPEQLIRFRADVLSALFYVANLRFMFVGQSYVDRNSAPSPVLTFWSLSLEEQFYLVLPWLILGAALLIGRRRRP